MAKTMNGRIARLVIPNVISNITIPLLGIVDVALAGRLAHGELAIAAIALGATIFNFIYWNCYFLRMGTGGMTAQAYGARNFEECANLLVRGVFVALSLAALLLIFQYFLAEISFSLMFSSDYVEQLARDYFFVRIWAAPATVSLYSVQGWLIGMQNSKTPMWGSLIQNFVNIALGCYLVFVCDMGIEGIAWATVAAQYSGLVFSFAIIFLRYSQIVRRASIAAALKVDKLLGFFRVNRDLFLRNACVVVVYTVFTSASSLLGDETLAINSLLLQLFTLYSYMSDGMAYAAEALVGRYIGAKNRSLLGEAVRKLLLWAALFSVFFAGVYFVAWQDILSLFTQSPMLLSEAQQYSFWIVFIPLFGSMPFLMDGILIGATDSRTMRDSIFFSALIFLILYFATRDVLGNHAIWFAFSMFFFARGVIVALRTRMLKSVLEIQD